MPERKVLIPCSALIPKASASEGLRMSRSTMRVRAPVWASAIAVLAAVVLFPSPGKADVTRMVCGGLPEWERRSAVRRDR